ncbi:MAG: M23 family metallopeptidase [Patescibacteria group bacterium]
MKKIAVEAGLAGIKTLHLTGRLLTKIVWVLASFFRLLFKGIFYKILGGIYYRVFRLKRNELAGQPLGKLFRDQLVYFFIFILTASLIFINAIKQSRAGGAEIKISKTVLAGIVTSELGSNVDEELIEETVTPSNLFNTGGEKYLDESCVLEKEDSLLKEEPGETDNLIAFNDDGDLIFKPQVVPTGTGADGSIPARQEIVYYTVQAGDTVSTIARQFGITVNTILWANNLSAFSLIRPGDSLTILPYSGLLYTVKSGDTLSKIARTYGIEESKILECNTLGNSLKIGQKLMLPGAKKLSSASTASKANSYTGLSVIKDLIKSPSVQTSGNKMAWPTVGYRITQYFSWRHNGVDIGNKVGTAIYAADAGIVEIAQGGWNGGYGNTILINHGGGKKTRYGHLSKLFVKVGDEVAKGENIGAMGSTGRSTGPHLHFEVIIKGTRYNPLNYIK